MSRAPFVPAASLEPGTGVVLYGAGNVGRDVDAVLRAHGFTIRAVFDLAGGSGRQLNGVPVLAPEGDALSKARGFPVVLTMFNRDADPVDVARKLHAHGLGPFVSFYDLHARFARELGDRFWLTDRGFLDAQAERIARAGALLRDARSRALYESLVKLRRDGRADECPGPDSRDEHYLPRDVEGWMRRRPARVADLGAYDGDTVERLLRQVPGIGAVAAFEPDPETFSRLAERARTLSESHPGVELLLWPCGAADRTGLRHFCAGEGESSRLDAAGSVVVPCVALDDALGGFAPTMVKMDVEGAELEALAGMRHLAGRHRPDLAISAYHHPGDLWDIPLLIDGWDLGYEFALRSHGHAALDLVLYALAPRSVTPSTAG